jgi:hypothetical protein
MQDLINAFDFITKNIHVAGWLALVGLAFKWSWRFSKFFLKLNESMDNGKISFDRLEKMEQTVNTVATNHLPHIQESSENLLEEMKGLRSDLIQILLSRKD